MKVLIVYYSRGGTVKQMAHIIGEEIKKTGIEVNIVFSPNINTKDLLDYDGIIIGSPTYYGTMASEVKRLLDNTVSVHGKLNSKVGGAFSSSNNIAGGNETTILSILGAMLIHGMIIQGDPQGDHYGPVAIAKIDARCEENCRRFGRRFSTLIKRIK